MGTEFLKIKECDEAQEIIQDLFDKYCNAEGEEIGSTGLNCVYGL